MGAYPVKQLIIIRKDLGMNKGKLAAQAAHASMAALLKARKSYENGYEHDLTIEFEDYPIVQEWLSGAFAKVVLAVTSEDELKAVAAIADEYGLLYSYIVDNGTTVFNGVPTPTCVGIGPARSEVLDELFGSLKLY